MNTSALDVFWAAPPQQVRLRHGHVHVWLARLDQTIMSQDHHTTLSGEEMHRAAKLVDEADRLRFLRSHVVLRWLLSRYLMERPDAIQLTRSTTGKPRLLHHAPLSFNMSHSDVVALYAFAWQRQLGVDIERVRPDADVAGIVDRQFAPSEVRAFKSTQKSVQTNTFFTYWVRKEAVLKAAGHGLHVPLSAVDVGSSKPVNGQSIARLHCGETSIWHIFELPLVEGYCAAIAVDDVPRRISCWRIA